MIERERFFASGEGSRFGLGSVFVTRVRAETSEISPLGSLMIPHSVAIARAVRAKSPVIFYEQYD